MMLRSFAGILGFAILTIFLSGCREKSVPEPAAGTLSLSIEHAVDGVPLRLNQLEYTNAAGNPYMVTDLMYFISEVTLYSHDGTTVAYGGGNRIFYVDEKMPDTKSIRNAGSIPAASYDSISLIFGIADGLNKTGLFTDPPEALMGWPSVLGGGYHYMMMNGRWETPSGGLVSYNFHLGIGQLYHGTTYNTDSIYAFVQNWFRVSLPGSSFTLGDKQNLTFTLTMNLAEWFRDPHEYDFNTWGGAIMQNQAAQATARENGWNVFSIRKN